ncbi:hypothetical protein BO83DRAFT_146261 [Aspergillus eucalypticola CBS 122712]|uniref:CorA-like transporter domain-containing protein n=1 Tax=Aspergillus eucalypticola (strain CBS 122712 / IBT 29274) TaxID=1448314 RepID=A0A317UQA8_ASPEC|nr:uncharacterized protein BO83DRAFT_146261 [Aspergillus eucalypticola CBS 122712]PWY64183.1 hypothetical protein BO83DRAFT_146261 [Aspergillus eucalypticola CBS 122712]
MTVDDDPVQIWRPYLQQLPAHHDPSSFILANLEDQFLNGVPRVLTRRNETRVRVTDVYDDHRATKLHTNSKSLQDFLTNDSAIPNGLNIRVVSIYSSATIAPLEITPLSMALLLERYAVHPSFIQVLLSFGRNVHISEAGNSLLWVNERDNDTYVSYQLNYVENTGRRLIPWSWRHTGVYHHRRQPSQNENGYDFFILLHPNQDSIADKRILNGLGIFEDSRLQPGLSRNEAEDQSILVHSLVLSSFICNWRWYLRYLGDRFEEYNDRTLVDLPDESTPRESYKTVSELRNLNDFALRTHICCRGNLGLVSALKPVIASSLGRRTLDSAGQALPGCEALLLALQGCIKSCEELIPRMKNAIDLAGYTLSLHNQLETASLDRELRDLTSSLKRLQEDNMNDSAAVKVITFVSAIYLPGSFIVSLYGMNFFVFDEDLRQIVIAKDFWVFLATWIPLTLITGLIYVLIVWFDAWWKRKPFRFFQRPGKEAMSEPEMQVGKEFSNE